MARDGRQRMSPALIVGNPQAVPHRIERGHRGRQVKIIRTFIPIETAVWRGTIFVYDVKTDGRHLQTTLCPVDGVLELIAGQLVERRLVLVGYRRRVKGDLHEVVFVDFVLKEDNLFFFSWVVGGWVRITGEGGMGGDPVLLGVFRSPNWVSRGIGFVNAWAGLVYLGLGIDFHGARTIFTVRTKNLNVQAKLVHFRRAGTITRKFNKIIVIILGRISINGY